jgi:hypothetical protein
MWPSWSVKVPSEIRGSHSGIAEGTSLLEYGVTVRQAARSNIQMAGLLNIHLLYATLQGLTQTPPKLKFKKTVDFVVKMISEVLLHLPFSRIQPLKSADESTLEFRKIS